MERVALTRFDEAQCHKWALLLKERKSRLDNASEAVASGDFETAKRLVDEVFHGASGRNGDAGMEGSLLYHLAMISKMSAESIVVLEELEVDAPTVDEPLWRFYGDFVFDSKELLEGIIELDDNVVMAVKNLALGVEEKIQLFRRLSEETRKVEGWLDRKDPGAKEGIQSLFEAQCHKWALLLKERKSRLDSASEAVASGDFETAKRLVDEVFRGASGRNGDAGMEGSLLYHLAMISKMSAESKVVLEELEVDAPTVDEPLWRFYGDFVSDS